MKIAILNILSYIKKQTKAIEMAIILALLWWAFILFVPMDTFSSSVAYKAMSSIASEGVWSAIFFVIGVVCLIGVLFEHYHLRQVGFIVATGLWSFIASMFAISYIATTSTGIYFIVASLTAYVVYKGGEEHGC